jgi:hypothetical protein
MNIDLPDEIRCSLIKIAVQQCISVDQLVSDILGEYVRSYNELQSELEAW